MATQHQINALTKISDGKTLPILGMVKFEKGRMLSTNLDIAITIDDADIIETGYVNPAKLKKSGVATIQKHWGLVNNKEFASEDWPEIPDATAPIALPEQTVNAMIDALVSVSKDDTRPVLTCIELRADGQVTSTDAYRLFTRNTGHDLTALIPSKVVELIKMTKLTKDWYIGTNDEQIILQNGNFKMVARTIDGKYPEWQKLAPVKAARRVTVRSALLYEALDLIDDGNIRLDQNGGVYVQSAGDNNKRSMVAVVKPETDIPLDIRDMQIVMPLKGDNSSQLLLNQRYVRDAAGKAEYIEFSFNEALAPVIVKGVER